MSGQLTNGVPQIFIGQIMGTAVGTELFNNHGWRASAAANLGWQSFALLVLLMRGPHCARYTWVGWEGGFAWRKNSEQPREAGKRPATSEKKTDECGDAEEKGATESPRKDTDMSENTAASK